MITADLTPVQASQIRRTLKNSEILPAGVEVESVAWIDRADNEFAALVIENEDEAGYEAVLEWLTAPNCQFAVVGERVGRRQNRIFIGLAI